MCRRFFLYPSLSDGCQSGDGRAFYEVSDLGRVRSLPRKGGRSRSYGGKILIGGACKGYPIVSLNAPGRARVMRAVHQLVLEAFRGAAAGGGHGGLSPERVQG